MRSPRIEKEDPIIGEWTFKLRASGPGHIVRFDRTGTWERPEVPGWAYCSGKWERRGEVVLVWRDQTLGAREFDVSKPLAEMRIDEDWGQIGWTSLQGSRRMTGKRAWD